MKMSVTLRQHFWKTKLCPLHMENRCKEGNNCDYAHSIEDLRSIPDLKRTKLCYKLLKGEKCFNKKCNYAHNQDELKSAQNLFAYKSSMCKFVANNTCLNGSTCRFAHSIDELRIPRIPDILLEKNAPIDMQNNLVCIGNNTKKVNNNGIHLNNTNIYNNNTDNFNKKLDTMINNFNAMNLMNEYNCNNTNIMKDIHNNFINKNNGVNYKGEKKRKEKIRNKNKDRQLKLKNFNYNKNESNTSRDAIVNNSISHKNNDQRERSIDSNTTISSSLNYMDEEKNKMNEANISNTYEKVDLNQCYGKTEENISNFSEHHINDIKTKGNKSRNKKKNNKDKDRSEGKNRKNSEIPNNMNYINNREYTNGVENQVNYIDYNYNYANNFPNPLLYNKIPIKFNTFNPYFNYNQLSGKICKNDANISNQYSQFIKPNEFVMYDHQNNMPYIPPNYYSNYLYYYQNPCNYSQFAMVDKINNNISCENINYNRGINESVINKANHEIKVDEDIEEMKNKKKEYEEIIDEEVNSEQMNSVEVNDEEINDGEINEEIENDENLNEYDANDEEINEEEESDEEMNHKEINNEKIKDEISEDDINGDDEISEEYVNGEREIYSEQNNREQIYENEINYEENIRDNNYEYNSRELKEKRENIKGNKCACIRKIINRNVNNTSGIENGVNTNINGNKNDENKKKNSNFLNENDPIKNEENKKQMNIYNKRENKQNKKKISKLVTLNNKKKHYKKETHMNNQEFTDHQRNNRNINIENMQEPKVHVNPSSVYSYIVNANVNAQNINYEKNIMKPLSNDMELYINKQYPINPLPNDPMIYNLNNRNYGYYYCAYPPSTFNDEVYLN